MAKGPIYQIMSDYSIISIQPASFSLHYCYNTILLSPGNITNQIGKDLSLDLWENFVSGISGGYPDVADYDPESISFFKPTDGIDCYPAPGPFLPCNDLFDWWTLRCGVWVVFLLALLGNGCVVFVLSFSRNKMDVPRFLVCNLAMADFFMGLYLGKEIMILYVKRVL